MGLEKSAHKLINSDLEPETTSKLPRESCHERENWKKYGGCEVTKVFHSD